MDWDKWIKHMHWGWVLGVLTGVILFVEVMLVWLALRWMWN